MMIPSTRISHSIPRWMAAFLFLVSTCFAMATEGVDPNLVKAGMVVQFARYTTWPKERVPDEEESFVIGVLGDEDFYKTISNEVKRSSVRVQNRFVEVRNIGPLEKDEQEEDGSQRLQKCVDSLHVLYVGGEDHRAIRDVLDVLEDEPVLTLSQAPRFAEIGGAVQFLIERNAMRFIINIDALNRAQLKIHSKVLDLAQKIVRNARDSE